MKKIIFLLIILILLILNIKEDTKKEELKGIFISYIELNKYVNTNNEETSKKNIDKMIENINNFKLNTIILQVRPSSDAIYDSKIFPYSKYISGEEGKKIYDVLDYFIKKTHEKNLKIYAWINPYRVRTDEDINKITINNPAYKYIGTDTLYVNNGIYYNPSKKEVQDLIINGVKEVLEYDVDGILFDDYFYPNNEIDINDYNKYIEENSYIEKKDYNLKIINETIEKIHDECKKKKVKFGISPDGNVENNYEKNFADIKLWMNSDKYIDFIIPQIYYGFYNTSKGYLKVSKEWDNLLKNKNIDLYIALAFYKVGREDKYAKEGRDEWLYNDNIIMKEILLSRNLKNYKGFALYRYDNLFDTNIYTNNSINEIENVKKIIK